jgi:hypothetical protein
LFAVFSVHDMLRLFSPPTVRIAHRDHLHIRLVDKRTQLALTHISNTDEPHRDTAARGNGAPQAQRRRRHDIRERQRSAGNPSRPSQKLASICLRFFAHEFASEKVNIKEPCGLKAAMKAAAE